MGGGTGNSTLLKDLKNILIILQQLYVRMKWRKFRKMTIEDGFRWLPPEYKSTLLLINRKIYGKIVELWFKDGNLKGQ